MTFRGSELENNVKESQHKKKSEHLRLELIPDKIMADYLRVSLRILVAVRMLCLTKTQPTNRKRLLVNWIVRR